MDAGLFPIGYIPNLNLRKTHIREMYHLFQHVMIRKTVLAASMLAISTFLSAQDAPPSISEALGHRYPTPRDLGIDAFESLVPEGFTLPRLLKRKNPMHAKSAASYTTRLDSVVTEESEKVIYNYGANGNCTLQAFYDWEEPNGWVIKRSEESVYNTEGLLADRIYQSALNSQMTLLPVFQFLYQYQEDNLVSEEIKNNWVDGAWVPELKFNDIYNDDGKLIETVIHTWDSDAIQFEEFGQVVYIYNAAGGLIERILSDRIDGDWIPVNRTEHTLNGQNQPILSIDYSWDEGLNDWVPITSEVFTYNPAGLQAEWVVSTWVDGEFLQDGRVTWEYDGMDRLTAQTIYSWNEPGESWGADTKEIWAYDDAGNVDETVFFFWNLWLEEFVPFSKNERVYNADVLVEEIMKPEWYGEDFTQMLLGLTYFEFIDGAWMEMDASVYYYSPVGITSVTDRTDQKFQVYPNPFQETIRFNGSEGKAQFSLFDLQGRMVLQKNLFGASELHVADLASGMYIYQITAEEGSQSGKLVRE
jgi:hypothetical protein